MKKTDIFLLVILFSAALISVIYFVPDKGKLAAELLAGTVKIGVRQSQVSFVKEYFSLNKLIHHEMGNPIQPLKEEVKKSSDDLTVTDDDILRLMQEAAKKAKIALPHVRGAALGEELSSRRGSVKLRLV